MQQIFAQEADILEDNRILVTGEDANHLGRAIRMKAGERLRVSTDQGRNFICEAVSFDKNTMELQIAEESADTEVSNRIVLYQAIPKGTRMETIIEKAVELGVSEIVPVDMKFCIVKLDDKKKKSKVERWQKIADSAAKQSKRSKLPIVRPVMSYKEAVYELISLDISLVPYENAQGVSHTKDVLSQVTPGKSVGVLIGPEGGFAPEEIDMVREDCEIITLGKRILRTDTAAITSLSLVMMASEWNEIIQ